MFNYFATKMGRKQNLELLNRAGISSTPTTFALIDPFQPTVG
jgi:hypothetical protein